MILEVLSRAGSGGGVLYPLFKLEMELAKKLFRISATFR